MGSTNDKCGRCGAWVRDIVVCHVEGCPVVTPSPLVAPPGEVRVCRVPGCAMVTVERIDLEWLLRRWEDLAHELDMLDNTPRPTVLDKETADDARTVARLAVALERWER